MEKTSQDNTKVAKKKLSKKESKAMALSDNLRKNLLRRKQKTRHEKLKEQPDV